MMNKTTEKDASIKLARKRMNVIEMAEALGNISEVCRRSGMDRTSFYEWKRCFQTHNTEKPTKHHQS
ncbi:MAG: helix-turn-helix domain-containing protein [Chloroflexi bacterium]|nr:helix-turn-helix domain-containing protein [Chloroflexota bacterium]